MPAKAVARYQQRKPASRELQVPNDVPESADPLTFSGILNYFAAKIERFYIALWTERGPVDMTGWSAQRKKLYDTMECTHAHLLLTCVIVASIVILVMETDAIAERGPLDDPVIPDPPIYLVILGRLVLVFYICELSARAYVFRRELFWRGYTTDCMIVIADVICVAVNFAGGVRLTFLRLIRFFRVLRLLRLLNLIPELRFLIKGIASSFSSVLWGIVLVFLIVVSLAIFATVTINPVSRKIASRPDSVCGDQCETAWSSVWRSLLTLTQTVLFGDSWGTTAIEIIHEEPWLLGFFLTAYATINLASLNLILAAIVDSGAQAREEGLESRRQYQRLQEVDREEKLQKRLLQFCKTMDVDYSGTLSLSELLHGFDYNASFREVMEGLKIDRDDLEIFFNTIDKHCHGYVDYNEFLALISVARRQGSQQVITFVKCA
eukprot:TRINITY_DN106033_c0_g1_i1.p1 TRINITY_DN106033_c0_g1~~TRINITY_DN106033_c0_g1_i1.p1  ORF type:complete len:436 (+),score=47.68 TRINITY_DN106033_c0_g1_i1:138-1445(+)